MDATETVLRFFDAYRAHDIEAMADLCSDNAAFRDVPMEFWRRQKVVRADGKARTVGKVMWTGMLSAFPDLTNEVLFVTADEGGHVAAEVTISGTQARDWGTVGNQGRPYRLRHLFIFDVGPEGLIDRIAIYSDNADLFAQLGRVEID
jgi:steroid delta-isomerase-like uncharacterized protein